VLSGGDSDPKSGNDLQSWTDPYTRYQTRAFQTRLHIPLLYGIDAVHGNNNVLGATIFPQNIGLGCTRDAALVERIGRITALEVRATGINWAFAPCVAVPQDIRWGRTYEGYSEDPGIVAELGAAAVRGLQWEGLSNPKAVLACAKQNQSRLADPTVAKSFGSAEHRLVARQALRESLVLRKNDNHVLPLKKRASRIHIAGASANDIGMQCGGWTVTWQGKMGDVIPGGTTILSAMKRAASNVTYSKDGSGAEGATVGVVVVGEKPYAEMFGDKSDLHLSTDNIAVIHRMKAAQIPVVLVLISGRPLLLDDVLGDVDAVVAAWLPGSEGEGVADVLFGDYKPTGKLSFTWPKANSTTLHRGGIGYQTLLALGYGLKY
jgi:hypothetical protein